MVHYEENSEVIAPYEGRRTQTERIARLEVGVGEDGVARLPNVCNEACLIERGGGKSKRKNSVRGRPGTNNCVMLRADSKETCPPDTHASVTTIRTQEIYY